MSVVQITDGGRITCKGKRVGPCMIEATRIASVDPGRTQYAITRAVGPYGSTYYGYRTLKRALGARLIELRTREGSPWDGVYVTALGRELLAAVYR